MDKMKRFIIMGLGIIAGSFVMKGAYAQSFGDDLCPNPTVATKQTPDDLAGVQADIERFALCLERAELLQSLNEISARNTDSLLGLNDGGLPAPFPTASTQLGAFPPVAPAGLDLERELGLDGDLEVSEEEDKTGPWVINDIYGTKADLRARITSKEGEIANVKRGDVLSDGMRVVSIKKSGITLKGDEEISLKWAR